MNRKTLIYLDNCCYNRPFDDQIQDRIYLETEAKLIIQRKINEGHYDLVWSYILDYENSENPDVETRNLIAFWKTLSSINIVGTLYIVERARSLHQMGFGTKDSLHLSCAIEASADFFLTVDLGILSKRNLVDSIMILNPIDFVKDGK